MFVRSPLATYRLQLRRGFGFGEAAALVDYLHALGISDLYTSPVFQAVTGSSHGYDVVDPSRLNPELGGEAAFARLGEILRGRGMGLLVDFVPNHMAIGSENPLWMDVLENGPSSVHAHVFDIEWRPVKEELEDRILVPVLGDQYGSVLEKGELTLRFEGGGFFLAYDSQRFPVAPRTYGAILRLGLDEAGGALGAEPLDTQEFLSILHALDLLPTRLEQDPKAKSDRDREKEVVKRRLLALTERSEPIRLHIERALAEFNGHPGEPASFDRLDTLLQQQSYRLAHWRVAAEEINYRRFFDINALAAIRMEDPRVMELAHARLLELIREERVTGLRIDHPDGLFSPVEYLGELRRLFGEDRPYLVVEKILSGTERLSSEWPVDGTTGYEFLNAVNGLFVDTRNRVALDETFSRFTHRKLDYAELVYQKRRQTMDGAMASEMNLLARQLNRLSELDRRTRDFTWGSLKKALIEVIASFPVYRTYLRLDGPEAEGHDREVVEWAVRKARQRNPAFSRSVFDFIREILLGERQRAFVMKVQQVTAPVMAKAVEDSVFYVFNRLIALNEVGGEPDRFGMSPDSFKIFIAERSRVWPQAMLATSTHDTKRSEDVRARIDALSELPKEWRRHLSIWARLNRRHKKKLGDVLCPDANEELMLYQTLLGVLPFEPYDEVREELTQRLNDYLLKAMREAKLNTSWVNPNEVWEKGARDFVEAILDPIRSARFWIDFRPFQARLARIGAINSLGMLVLKLVLPGVSDFYQGSELWDLSLVDPDNRRPVDFEKRRRLLGELEGADPMSLAEQYEDGRIKLYVTSRLLRLKRRLASLWREGALALPSALGERSEHLMLVARAREAERLVAVVPRLVAPLVERHPMLAGAEVWGNTWIPLPNDIPEWVEVLSGARITPQARNGGSGVWARELFQGFPEAVLVSPERV